MVVKSRLEPGIDPLFHPDSYGYRPGKSALDAVGQARQRCWKFDWVIDLDIKGFFDKVDHDHMEKFVRHRIGDERIVRLILKWMKAGVMDDGQWSETEEGTPQGSVMTP